jgi:two-component system chemotaxis response regulator CheB
MPVRVLVVDDSMAYRHVLTEALRSLPNVEVVGSASNGAQVLAKVTALRPDLLTLDIEMPGMNGIEVMDALNQARTDVKVLVVSSVTVSGGTLTLQALQKGAFDFITKPTLGSLEVNLRAIREELDPRIRAIAHRLTVQNMLRSGTMAANLPECRSQSSPGLAIGSRGLVAASIASAMRKPELVVIGVSTGGPNALTTIFSALPGDLGVPILIVQHMPPIFTGLLANSLSAAGAIKVREASNNEEVLPNVAYLAPGGRQMRLVSALTSGMRLQITDDPPENSCRPSVDYFFRSVAQNFSGKTLAVILTGMGEDGTQGLRLLKRRPCTVIAQDEASCVVFGMPKSAIDAGLVDAELPLNAIAERITKLVRGSRL